MVQRRPVYFGYGSNMWLDQMNRRCPDHICLGIGYLRDWKWYICEAGFANIKRSPGDTVYGLIFEISESDEATLDRCETVPVWYLKEHHKITSLGTKASPQELVAEALIYVNEEWLTESKANEEYLYRMNMAIADGIKEGIPEDYMEKYLRPFIPKECTKPDDF
ncbi:Gamma-glutamylcyclotransferase [Leucoagaricus sp. SymC.cos]|nr:Gamma-glutamylcyclotransferase [Leucoagaricus sp. SymC.cos]